MELIRNGGEKKISDKIYFKQSVTEIVDTQKTQAIKSILNTVDLVVEPEKKDSEVRRIIRKSVLDNVNDLNRVFTNIVESLVGNKKSGDVSKVHGQ